VQVVNAADGVEVLRIATAVAFRELRVDKRSRMLGLVHITDVVDEQAEHERALVGLSREAVDNLRNVG